MEFRFEKELEQAAIPFLKSFLIYYVWQVPLYTRMIDLVGIDRNDQLIGIEFKLKNWKRALQQAYRNVNAFDYVYVCLPDGRYRNDLITEAQKWGIGVLIYDFNKKGIVIASQGKKIVRQWQPNVAFLRSVIDSRRSA